MKKIPGAELVLRARTIMTAHPTHAQVACVNAWITACSLFGRLISYKAVHRERVALLLLFLMSQTTVALGLRIVENVM